MWRFLVVLLVCCAACEKPDAKSSKEQSIKPYDQRKNEELKALRTDLEGTMVGRTEDVEKAVVESSQE